MSSAPALPGWSIVLESAIGWRIPSTRSIATLLSISRRMDTSYTHLSEPKLRRTDESLLTLHHTLSMGRTRRRNSGICPCLHLECGSVDGKNSKAHTRTPAATHKEPLCTLCTSPRARSSHAPLHLSDPSQRQQVTPTSIPVRHGNKQ